MKVEMLCTLITSVLGDGLLIFVHQGLVIAAGSVILPQ